MQLAAIYSRLSQLPCSPRCGLLSFLVLAAPGIVGISQAQDDPSGIEFCTIGDLNNPGYDRSDPYHEAAGHGQVSYQYGLGKTEVTTAQWMEFYNAFYGRSPWIEMPQHWGASGGTSGQLFSLNSSIPNAGMIPSSGMTWRTAAMFCNWLCNGKSSDMSAVMTGAYDVSTFGEVGGVFTDQLQHTAGARYWIPTRDELLKGTHYDPNKFGVGRGGWWESINGTDTLPTIGPPGVGQANIGNNLFSIPLGAYPDVLTPWGLLDAGGASAEMLETPINIGVGHPGRGYTGSAWTPGSNIYDYAFIYGAQDPWRHNPGVGLRIASLSPAPQVLALTFLGLGAVAIPRRR